MTIGELIEKLKRLPQDLPVYLSDPEEDQELTSASIEDALPGTPPILPRRIVLEYAGRSNMFHDCLDMSQEEIDRGDKADDAVSYPE